MKLKQPWPAMLFFLLLALIGIVSQCAQANTCGLAPMVPLGCQDAVCVCDEDGDCRWVFICNRGD